MTIPAEEQDTLKRVKKWLHNKLLWRGKRQGVVEERREIASLLRHYPMDYRIDQVYDKEVKQWEKELLGKDN